VFDPLALKRETTHDQIVDLPGEGVQIGRSLLSSG
jgi:hypothetical protein